jgi:hypothetical protein
MKVCNKNNIGLLIGILFSLKKYIIVIDSIITNIVNGIIIEKPSYTLPCLVLTVRSISETNINERKYYLEFRRQAEKFLQFRMHNLH